MKTLGEEKVDAASSEAVDDGAKPGADEGGKDAEDTALSDEAFQEMAKEVEAVSKDIGNDPLLADYLVEYEKLAKSMKSAFENQTRVESKCTSLQGEIDSIREELKHNTQVGSTQQERKLRLTEEIEEAWTGVKDAHNRSSWRAENGQRRPSHAS